MITTDTRAGAALRQARQAADLTQRQLAQRAGVTQSVISTYEAGKRQPAMPTLANLIDAAGCELILDVHRYSDGLEKLSGPIGRQVRKNRNLLIEIAAAYDIHNLRVFGSVARGEEHATSDLDLLIDCGTRVSLFALAQACDALESVVRTRVDLVPAHDLKPALRLRVNAEAVAL